MPTWDGLAVKQFPELDFRGFAAQTSELPFDFMKYSLQDLHLRNCSDEVRMKRLKLF